MAGQSSAPSDAAPHLLVVDDDRRIRDLLLRFLLAEGYRVTTAETAAEARGKLGGLSFDLLILDVMMPGENGFELVRAIRSGSGVPILMLTAPGETVPRLALAGNGGGVNERAVDVQVNRLRRKIERDPANPLIVQTVRGIGYRLMVGP